MSSSPDSYPYVSSLFCAFFMCLTPLWIVISSKHPASRTLLYSGWEPVITAMVISRCVCVNQLFCICNSQCLLCLMIHPQNKLQHIHPQVPLSLADSQMKPVGREWLPLSLSLVLVPASQHSVQVIAHFWGFIEGHTSTNIGSGHHKLKTIHQSFISLSITLSAADKAFLQLFLDKHTHSLPLSFCVPLCVSLSHTHT